MENKVNENRMLKKKIHPPAQQAKVRKGAKIESYAIFSTKKTTNKNNKPLAEQEKK